MKAENDNRDDVEDLTPIVEQLIEVKSDEVPAFQIVDDPVEQEFHGSVEH